MHLNEKIPKSKIWSLNPSNGIPPIVSYINYETNYFKFILNWQECYHCSHTISPPDQLRLIKIQYIIVWNMLPSKKYQAYEDSLVDQEFTNVYEHFERSNQDNNDFSLLRVPELSLECPISISWVEHYYRMFEPWEVWLRSCKRRFLTPYKTKKVRQKIRFWLIKWKWVMWLWNYNTTLMSRNLNIWR